MHSMISRTCLIIKSFLILTKVSTFINKKELVRESHQSFINKGDCQIWTGDQGVAVPCLTTWLSHQNSPSRARTYNNSVNSRVLYHWAIEDYQKVYLIIIPSKFHTELTVSSSRTRFYQHTRSARMSPGRTSEMYSLKRYIEDVPHWSSPRPISNSQLHMLPCFHLCPIYLVVFKGSYSIWRDISSWGGLHA